MLGQHTALLLPELCLITQVFALNKPRWYPNLLRHYCLRPQDICNRWYSTSGPGMYFQSPSLPFRIISFASSHQLGNIPSPDMLQGAYSHQHQAMLTGPAVGYWSQWYYLHGRWSHTHSALLTTPLTNIPALHSRLRIHAWSDWPPLDPLLGLRRHGDLHFPGRRPFSHRTKRSYWVLHQNWSVHYFLTLPLWCWKSNGQRCSGSRRCYTVARYVFQVWILRRGSSTNTNAC